MAFWLCDSPVSEGAKEIIEKFHPHLIEAKIAFLFSDKRKVNGNHIVLGVCKRISAEDRILSKYDFKIILSAEDWADLTTKQRQALLDHELSHCDVERVPMVEAVGGRKKPVRDKYGRKIYTKEVKTDDNGKPKWKIHPHDFENFTHIAERYGIETASIIGGYLPVEVPAKKAEAEEAIPASKAVPAGKDK